MSQVPYMQFYVSDYLGDTQHLTTEQHGAYLLLLMTMWRSGGSLPHEHQKLARICRLSVKKWASIRDEVMAFFVVGAGTISQNRLTKEIKKVEGLSQKRSSAGAKGGASKALKIKDTPVAIANDLLCGLPQQYARVPEPDSEREKERTSNDVPKKADPRGSRIPEDWTLSASLLTWSMAQVGASRQLLDRSVTEFKNYWESLPAAKARKVNWDKTWQNRWIQILDRKKPDKLDLGRAWV